MIYGPVPAVDPDACVLAEDVFPAPRPKGARWKLRELRRARQEVRDHGHTVKARRRIAKRYGATWKQLYAGLRNHYGFSLRNESMALHRWSA